MDNSSGLDNDSVQSSIDIAGGSSGSSEDRSCTQNKQSASGPSGQPKFSNGPHIRSRITVVCAECKRLKLKCDRRTPCSSCLKRDTVQRCIYSQAAAEKIDVQSLHNRLLVVEGTLSQLSASSGSSSSLSSALGNIPPFKSSYPTQTFTQPSSSANFSQGPSTSFNGPGGNSSSALAGLPCNDKALLAIGPSGSSVVISLEDAASIWLGELDLSLNESSAINSTPFPPFTSGVRPGANANGKVKVKLEPSPVLLPPSPSSLNGHSSNASSPGGPPHTAVNPTAFIPPLPHSIFLPSSATSLSDPRSSPSNGSSNLFSSFSSTTFSATSSELPQVTPALLQHLPTAPSTRAYLMRLLGETMKLHPCFNVRHFERRVEAMMTWGESPSTDPPADDGRPKTRELARELFLGIQPARKRKPTLSFFAAAAAAFALSALVANENGDSGPGANSSATNGTLAPGPIPSSAVLYALSDQALNLFEKTSSYDVDSLVAMILQVLYQLHDGQMRIAQSIFPTIAKMVNIARMMGLGTDPDEFPGTYSLFDAETRRRVWWDIYYYDVFISDCMGQSPLITEGSFTTKLPADVDEHQFTSSSTSLSPPSVEGDHCDKSFTFFILKCKLAQLVKSIRKQTIKDSAPEDVSDLSIDQVASSESDVSIWLSELPQRYHLEADPDLSHISSPSSSSPTLTAQRCSLAMTAARIVLKLYLPFLKDTHTKPPHQALLGTITAAHSIVSAARLLHSIWKGTRPSAFDFYDYGRMVFDAAVVCAHTVIQQPTSIMVSQAIQVVNSSMDLLREIGTSRGDECPNDAWKIVDMMRRKAELSRANGTCADDANAGSKRKRSDSEDNSFDHGLQLPYVGASITSAKTDQARPMLAPSRPPAAAPKELTIVAQKPTSDSSSKSSGKEKEKEKERKYPTVGIRVRPGQGRPVVRQRTNSQTPNSPLSLNSSTASMSVQGVSHPEPVPTPAPSIQISESPLSGFSTSQQQQQPMRQDLYPTNEAQRYTNSFPVTPQPMQAMYDPSSASNSYPGLEHMQSAYNPPPENYYVSYPQGGSSSFEVAPMSQNQGLSMAEYGVQSASTPIDSSVPSTPVDHSYMLPGEKHPSLGYGPPRRTKTDHDPSPVGHEYHQQPPQPMPIIVQGWPHAAQNQTTWDYKFYNGVAG